MPQYLITSVYLGAIQASLVLLGRARVPSGPTDMRRVSSTTLLHGESVVQFSPAPHWRGGIGSPEQPRAELGLQH